MRQRTRFRTSVTQESYKDRKRGSLGNFPVFLSCMQFSTNLLTSRIKTEIPDLFGAQHWAEAAAKETKLCLVCTLQMKDWAYLSGERQDPGT